MSVDEWLNYQILYNSSYLESGELRKTLLINFNLPPSKFIEHTGNIKINIILSELRTTSVHIQY
jgi:hypothetical protein